jgi:hypothetical protein
MLISGSRRWVKASGRKGPRYSINVIGGQTVWLYKPGVPGHVLGTLEQCGPDAIGKLLRRAAEEFGKQLGKTTAQD